MSALQSGWNGMFPLETFKGNTAHIEMSMLLCFVFTTLHSLASLSRAALHQHPNPLACVPCTLVTGSPHSSPVVVNAIPLPGIPSPSSLPSQP